MRYKEHKFSLANYKDPTQFKRVFYENFIRFAVYQIWASAVGTVKFGKMTEEERIARQVEGFKGWNKHYQGTSAIALRRGLEKRNLYEKIHKDDVIITVYDYTPWFRKQLCEEDRADIFMDYDRLLLNKEAEFIQEHTRYYGSEPPLNIQKTKRKLSTAYSFNKLFE